VKKVPQVELKLPSWKVSMQSLVTHGLLAEEELDPLLLGLEPLHDRRVIVPLEDLTALAGLGDSSLENSLLLQKVMKMRSPLG
jgi:hypothetical protein